MPIERVKMTELAVKRNPYNDIYRAEVGLAYSDAAVARLAGQLGDPNTSVDDAKAQFLKAEQSFLDTIEFAPAEYDNYVFLANLYNTMSEYFDPSYSAKAIDIARRGVEVEPYGPAVRAELARALAVSGRAEEAIREASYALEARSGLRRGRAAALGDLREERAVGQGAGAAQDGRGRQTRSDRSRRVDPSYRGKPHRPVARVGNRHQRCSCVRWRNPWAVEGREPACDGTSAQRKTASAEAHDEHRRL